MARFAKSTVTTPASTSYGIGAKPLPAFTWEGGQGFQASDPHAELFNAALSGLLSDQFYESGDQRIGRLIALVPKCDPSFLRPFLHWLRDTGGMRSASIVIAVEYARHGGAGSREMIANACRRADEPSEVLGFFISRYGRNIPSRIKRGLSDAMQRLYSERSFMRYDGSGKDWRFGDVINMTHAEPKNAEQSALYKYALDRRRHNDEMPNPEVLPHVHKVLTLEHLPKEERRAHLLEAGKVMSWERLAGWLPGGMDAAAWEAVIPNMGHMALLRNLNNLEKSAISQDARLEVCTLLSDRETIRSSRVLPFRYLTAYLNVIDDTYKMALRVAADVALENLPHFDGSTLVMVDCSGSMQGPVGAGKSRNPLSRSQCAGFMAEALARRCASAMIVCYDNAIMSSHAPAKGVGVLKASADPRYQARGGTSTWGCTAKAFRQGQYDRVVIITDEQSADRDDGAVTVPVVTWNICGYDTFHTAHGLGGTRAKRLLVSGYSDSVLQLLPSVVAGGTGKWPWETVA